MKWITIVRRLEKRNEKSREKPNIKGLERQVLVRVLKWFSWPWSEDSAHLVMAKRHSVSTFGIHQMTNGLKQIHG